MPPKNPWQHDTINLNNKGVDLIHPIEQVGPENYSRMDDVKSLQEGTLTPRPGTGLINSTAIAVSTQPVAEGQIPRVWGDGTPSPNHSLDAPHYGFTANLLYLIAIHTETGSTPATVSALTGGGTSWVLIAKIDFGTIASPKSTVHLFRGMPASTVSTDVSYTTDIATPTFFAIHEFTGIDTGGSDGSLAIVQSSTTAADLAGGTSLTTTLSAFGSVNNATFAIGQCNDGNRSFAATSPMVELYDGGGGGTLKFTALFVNVNDTTPETVLDTARDNAILAVEIKAA